MSGIKKILQKQRAFFREGETRNVEYRMQALRKLRAAIRRNESAILAALQADLHKAPFEGYETEVGIVLEEISLTLRHLREWSRPRRVRTPIVHFPSRSTIYSEPYGVVLIMSPWNYPFQLTMAPLAGAIAAGNCVVLKPSEYSPRSAEVMEKLVKEVFPEEYVAVVRGGREANKNLLEERFDYLFFTGSLTVGKAVMEAAAKHLTPVTLELGGKSPCVVDSTANIRMAAKRIVWGKFLNAGQTCVAPDYVYVQKSVKAELIKEMKKAIHRFYGEAPLDSPDYPRVINGKHLERLRSLLPVRRFGEDRPGGEDTHDMIRPGGKLVEGGQVREESGQIAPSILTDVTWEDPVMQEEIFGPVLPLLEFDEIGEVWEVLAHREKPLAFYLFTGDPEVEKEAMRRVSFGGGCVNDTIIHLANSSLPFGGVGNSGMGQYHGKNSFDTFSHWKGVVKKSDRIDIPLRYPPYGEHLSLLRKLMR